MWPGLVPKQWCSTLSIGCSTILRGDRRSNAAVLHQNANRKAGIAYTALDNGFATCADPVALQAICDRLGPQQIDALLRKWLRSCRTVHRGDRAAEDNRYESRSCRPSSP